MGNLQRQEVANDLVVSQKMPYEEFLKLEERYENRYENIVAYKVRPGEEDIICEREDVVKQFNGFTTSFFSALINN